MTDIGSQTLESSDRGVLLSILTSVNQLIGRFEGFSKRVETVENRQADFEIRCSDLRNTRTAQIDAINHRIDQWSGMGRAVAVVLALLSGAGTLMGIYNILK